MTRSKLFKKYFTEQITFREFCESAMGELFGTLVKYLQIVFTLLLPPNRY